MAENKPIIGISENKRYENYARWITSGGGIPHMLSSRLDNLEEVAQCDGVVFTGGKDIHPERYGKGEHAAAHEQQGYSLDAERDAFEFELFDRAVKMRKPIFGICRGMQLANIYFGGSLVLDIHTDQKTNHTWKGEDNTHEIEIASNSQLAEIVGTDRVTVNSAHHQAVDTLAPEFVVTAKSNDGVIEAVERENKEAPFMMLVQWHPERQKTDVFVSERMRDAFLQSCRKEEGSGARDESAIELEVVS